MEQQLFTIHRQPRSGEIEVVGEAGWLAVIPPLWAMWEGLWLSLGLMLALMAAAAALVPLGLGAVYVALIALCTAEGGAIHRLELRLRGWRVVALAEATTHEGAEELYLTGRALTAPEVPAGQAA